MSIDSSELNYVKAFLIKIILMGAVGNFFETDTGKQLQDQVAEMVGVLNDPKTISALINQTSNEEGSLEMAAKHFKDLPKISGDDLVRSVVGDNPTTIEGGEIHDEASQR